MGAKLPSTSDAAKAACGSETNLAVRAAAGQAGFTH